MIRQLPLLIVMVLVMTACQSAGSGGPAATLETARQEAEPVSREPVAVERQQEIQEKKTEEAPAARPVKSASLPAGDNLLDAAVKIGRLQKAQGTLAAMDVVFKCYERAKQPNASINLAKVCATQDFVVSKSVEEGRARRVGGNVDVRAGIIARRVASRIGALMQLKGMQQAEFNRFGLYLHKVAKPAHIRAMS